MKQVTFLMADGVLKPSCLFGAIEVFQKANEFYENKGQRPFYDIRLAGVNLQQKLLNTLFSIQGLQDLAEIKKTDVIILPSFDTRDDFAINSSREALEWVTAQYKEGAEVASLCTGAFLLAATGLLKGQSCSTHWKAEGHFRNLFPELNLTTNKIITDHKGIYTAGGAVSSLNLILYLVEKYNGREVALYCAKVLQIDIERNSQSPFIVFEGLKEHPDDEIRLVQDYIENHIEEKVTVDFLADRCAMNRINFSRRFKRATKISPVDYIQRVKMEAAKRGLESGRKNINEVMYGVGYTDVKAFRTIFKKVAGITPLEYRSKFSQAALL
ncbi:GlxA family transcriptional regulator [Mucilaginibacter sp. OK098]|uniref:GlxA family transcriptional regulator n=1 Tax=Mucilaginibacter sp. OK098 TaxID=1855297 RepID=UPI0009183F93|nr:helix-turn-helix domain-containing protein [Mucilaginibacter sp. OK098]SHM83093.1 transcriptional regulator, AraC family with amidase-like domain [Mucilaginibacter sp. OK098]